MPVKLRPYQVEAKQRLRQGYASGKRRLGISLPTGTGKTVIFSSIAEDAYAKGTRVVVLVHRDTLVDQAYRKLAQVIPEHALGIVKATKNEVTAPVIVASVHTLRNPERLRQMPTSLDGRTRLLTVVDEAHVSVSPTYHMYYQHTGSIPGGPGLLAGFTATWMRNDRQGLGDIWEEVVFKKSIKWAVRNGFLVRPEALQVGSPPDLSSVRTIKDPNSENYGDYNDRDLAEVVMVEDLLDNVVKGYHEHAAGKPAVLFAPTTASARYFLDGLRDSGVPVAEIFAGTGKAARAWNFASFDAGTTHVLGTCTALAEGWDSPRCEVALMVRPTRSMLLFIQTVGRILRPWPGKSRGLILDFVGVCDDKDMRSIVDLSLTPEAREADAPCPACERELCPECQGCRNSRCAFRQCDCDENDDFERIPMQRTAKKITGTVEVDLFAGTDARWLMTTRGIPFVQTPEHTYFIAMVSGEYGVGRMGAKRNNCACHGPGKWIATGMTSEEALDHGSDIALAEDPGIAHKGASWRNRKEQPRQAQIDFATQLGINPEGMSRAELSDQISIKVASGLLARIGASQ